MMSPSWSAIFSRVWNSLSANVALALPMALAYQATKMRRHGLGDDVPVDVFGDHIPVDVFVGEARLLAVALPSAAGARCCNTFARRSR